MRRVVVTVLFALAAAVASFGQSNADEARKELNEGARAYRAGRFAEAEQRFRRALELDPSQKNTPLFIARAVQQQYKPGLDTPENIAVGERAIAAYQDILNNDPRNEDAYKAIIFLYGQLKRGEKVNELLLWRANDFSATNAQRAEAFTILASKQWQCSYELTERKENKTTESTPEKLVLHYKMPEDAGDFIRARQCATDGLQLAEQAVTLDPKNTNAWSYKANLLREAAKLAEMEGDASQQAEYNKQYGEALERQVRLSKEAARATAGAVQDAPPPPPPPATGNPLISGGVLNGKAVSKPEPAYPEEAKAAGVQGTVTVHILVDEEGNVIEAQAVSGHPLLYEAAVAAARQAKFSQTRLSGRPVRVSGLVTYNFVLR